MRVGGDRSNFSFFKITEYADPSYKDNIRIEDRDKFLLIPLILPYVGEGLFFSPPIVIIDTASAAGISDRRSHSKKRR